MILSNKDLMIVSKFALQAKKHIGLVKVAEMCSNEKYTCKILAKATLSENQELVNLTKLISQEFHVGISLIQSIESYIDKIKAQNGSENFILARKFFLPNLIDHLFGIDINGASYREAVENFLKTVEAKDRTFCINLAREFYLIWRSANKPTTQIERENTLKSITNRESFIKRWDNIDLEILTYQENLTLSLYKDSMAKRAIVEKDIIISQKIAKVILLELRVDYSTTAHTFRNAIDRNLELFERLELRTLFLIVSREFYHFCVFNDKVIENQTNVHSIIRNTATKQNFEASL